MKYGVKFEEGKKIVSLKIMWILILIFIIFNSIIIISGDFYKNEMKAISTIGEKFGYKVDDDLIKNLELENKGNFKKLNLIINKYYKKIFSSIEDFLDDEIVQNIMDNKDKIEKTDYENLLYIVSILDYKNLAQSLDEKYNSINIKEFGDAAIRGFNLSGNAKNIVLKNYKNLEQRYQEIKNSKEYKQLFYYGKDFEYHSFLFKDILSKVLLEIVILIVLITSFLINYERDNKTNLLISSTKNGRKTEKDKLFVLVIASIIISLIMLIATFVVYFIVYDYSSFWNTSINSMFNWESFLPTLSWFNLSFIQYLGLHTIVIMAIAVIICIMSFIIALLSKSSYKSLFIFIILFVVMYLLPTMFSKSSAFLVWSHFNVCTLITSIGGWFIHSDPFTTFKYYEFTTMLLNFLIVAILARFVYKRYKKEDLA